MDTFFIGDIPLDYHYAIFNQNYIDLYNTPIMHNGTYTYYRLYINSDYFYYDVFTRYVTNNQTFNATSVNVSNDICYRKDFDSIVVVTFIIAFFGVWLFNIITSSIRKGGLLGGLL